MSGTRAWRLLGADRLLKAASVDSVVISARKMGPERLNNLETLCNQHHVQLSRLRVSIEGIIEPEADTFEKPRPALRQAKF